MKLLRPQVCYSSFDQLCLEKSTSVRERLDALDERIAALDAHFAREKVRINAEIEQRMLELMTMLNKFQELFNQECLVRMEREEAIKIEMNEHEVDVGERFKTEACERESVSPLSVPFSRAGFSDRYSVIGCRSYPVCVWSWIRIFQAESFQTSRYGCAHTNHFVSSSC